MEEYLLSQLDEPVMIQVKDNTGRPTGETTTLKAADGHIMTKQEAIATNILNLAMKGDVKASSQTDLSVPVNREAADSELCSPEHQRSARSLKAKRTRITRIYGDTKISRGRKPR